MNAIEQLVREMPLSERIDKSITMIGSMCAEGRYPKMSVPVRPTDEDVFITVTLRDAKSEIEALHRLVLNLRPTATDADIDDALKSFQ